MEPKVIVVLLNGLLASVRRLRHAHSVGLDYRVLCSMLCCYTEPVRGRIMAVDDGTNPGLPSRLLRDF